MAHGLLVSWSYSNRGRPVRESLKSLPIPVATARRQFANLVAKAKEGQRIKLTRHGRNVAWVIGPSDRENLRSKASSAKSKRTIGR